MRVERRHLTLTLILLFVICDVLCNTWKVELQDQHICAVKGSSVVIHCSFYRPDNLRVKRVVWGHVKSRHVSGRVIFDSNVRRAATRYQYTGDKYHSCSLKIHKVLQNDAGKYIITFNSFKMDTWRGNAGPTLKVVDLKVLVTKTNGNETMKEGDFVNLTCLNRCDARDPASAFNWFKNGEPINEGAALYLSNISPANSGNYTCSLKTQAGTSSGVMHIDVEYGPKNTTVSVSSSGADTDSNITLVCSSHSNPPVANYTWFKIDADIVEVGHQPIFIPGDRGQYLCSVTNKHGSQNSSTVNLKTESYWTVFTRDILITAIVVAVALLLSLTTVTAVRRLSKKSMWAPKTDCENITQNSDYVNWFTCDKHEGIKCGGGTTDLIYSTLDLKHTQNNMGQQMVSDEDVIYSIVC